eukprot:2350437-Amphidinium_carterae.1
MSHVPVVGAPNATQKAPASQRSLHTCFSLRYSGAFFIIPSQSSLLKALTSASLGMIGGAGSTS